MTTATLPVFTARGRKLTDGAARVLRIVESWPESTGAEIAARLDGMPRFEVSVWLLWLRRERMVRETGEREGHTTWKATKGGVN